MTSSHDATGFVSGCELYGQVSRFAGVESDNLTQGQWALLLTRKKERPVLEQEPVAYGKETLLIQVGKEKAILDTVSVWIDYGKLPEYNRPDEASWSSLEKDSAWIDEGGWYVRYNHAFLASLGSRKGYGSDNMSVSVFSEQFNEEPQYIAGVSITLPGDTTLSFSWDPDHIAEKPEAYPFHTSGFQSGMEQFGEVRKNVGNGNENLAQGQWA